MQRIFRLLLVASAIVVCGLWFVHWSRTRALNNGEVHVRQQPGDNAKPETPQTETASQPAQPQEVASNSGEQTGAQPNTSAALPAAETLNRNSPNGMIATGAAKFELYRQNDLTFRLNTETGDACVLFATEALWRKSLVYDLGCNNRH
jgi:hypothetical protein